MNFLLSGYYGYANAGDEAVLAAILEALSSRVPTHTQFVVTSGDPERTVSLHSTPQHHVTAIPRQHPQALLQAMRACDVFISGGGSLLQDVTSLRNVVYYTGLMRLARLSRKPLMIYAQGVGPLRKSLSQKLARAAMQGARIITVRDPDSKALLERIGVRRAIEVTADPVWALECGVRNAERGVKDKSTIWCAALRSWLHIENASDYAASMFKAVFEAARSAQARLEFLPMQPPSDGPLIEENFRVYADAQDSIMDTVNLHPREIMAQTGQADLMIGMRLHALIFAAAQGVPCVAVNYDPKVVALAKLIGAPLLQSEDFTGTQAAPRLVKAINAAQLPDTALIADLKQKAFRNADLAVSLM